VGHTPLGLREKLTKDRFVPEAEVNPEILNGS